MTPPDRPLILVVDDEPMIRATLSRLLERHGYATLNAETVGEAIRAAELHHVTAVVLDLSLKGSDSGLHFLAWLRLQSRYAQSPVLILTGLASLADDEEELIRRHHAYVFYKPQPHLAIVEYLDRLVVERG